ncbi:MAG TPA: hypothetical protein VIY08_01040 [Candidatus Nitrosocosmicus sp.]
MSECVVDFNAMLNKCYTFCNLYNIDNSVNFDYLDKIAKNFTHHFKDVKILNPYVTTLKTIAYHFQSNPVLLTHSKIYDFFVTSYKFLSFMLQKTGDNYKYSELDLNDPVIFDICNDILNNYVNYDDSIKIQIPNLIVDVLSTVFFKSDPYGIKVSSFQIKSYYMSKKESIVNKKYSYPSIILSNDLQKTEPILVEKNSDALFVFVNKICLNNDNSFNDDIVFRISQITHRHFDSVKSSLSTLNYKEIKKLVEICNNYNKIIKYGKFDSIQDFKTELEKDLRRSLSDKQVRHSLISVKKVQFYVEGILDNKFEVHPTHGINHVKHNFEYGYRLVGLLKSSNLRNNEVH